VAGPAEGAEDRGRRVGGWVGGGLPNTRAVRYVASDLNNILNRRMQLGFASLLHGKTATLCVRRATFWDEEKNEEDPVKKGICSNFLCDAKPGAEVNMTGPVGDVMLLPEDPATPVLMVEPSPRVHCVTGACVVLCFIR